jgi:DeoR/GlpR family transcriptional regulator of sugar metabolism
MRAAAVLSHSRTARLLVPGGFVRPIEQSFVGAETIHALAQHVFDAFVMTASGLSIAAGVTEWNPEDAPVKRAALASSSRCIVACDSTKLGQTAFTRVADLNVIDLLVTDSDADPELIGEIERLGIEVVVVGLEASTEQFAT